MIDDEKKAMNQLSPDSVIEQDDETVIEDEQLKK